MVPAFSSVVRTGDFVGSLLSVPYASVDWLKQRSPCSSSSLHPLGRDEVYSCLLHGKFAKSPGRGLIWTSKHSNCSEASAFQGPPGAGPPLAGHLGFWLPKPRLQGSREAALISGFILLGAESWR